MNLEMVFIYFRIKSIIAGTMLLQNLVSWPGEIYETISAFFHNRFPKVQCFFPPQKNLFIHSAFLFFYVSIHTYIHISIHIYHTYIHTYIHTVTHLHIHTNIHALLPPDWLVLPHSSCPWETTVWKGRHVYERITRRKNQLCIRVNSIQKAVKAGEQEVERSNSAYLDLDPESEGSQG